MPLPPPSPRILVIIPCRNEESRVGEVIRAIRAILPRADIIVVDDASSDGTGAEAASAGATVLKHGCNLGYGAALETGYLHAVRHNYDIVLQMDGDGQHIAEELPRLLQPLADGQADLVLGSRYSSAGGQASAPLIRRLGHRFFSGLILLLTGRRFSDPTSGFQGLSKRALHLFSGGFFPCDYPDSDVLLMSIMSGLRIREVPVRMLPRSGGVSMHAGLRPLYYGMKMLLSIFIVLLNFRTWHRWRRAHEVPASGFAEDRKGA